MFQILCVRFSNKIMDSRGRILTYGIEMFSLFQNKVSMVNMLHLPHLYIIENMPYKVQIWFMVHIKHYMLSNVMKTNRANLLKQ